MNTIAEENNTNTNVLIQQVNLTWNALKTYAEKCRQTYSNIRSI